MLIVFSKDVLDRLAGIERDEGVPATEVVHQAVEIFSHLEGEERQQLGQAAIGLVAARVRR